MTATAPDLGVVDRYGHLHAVIGERTLEILERRRRAPVVRRRGWLVRRALLAADVVGLTAAFVTTDLVIGRGGRGQLGPGGELLLFVLTLPIWILIAKMHRLYDRDEERTDHSTADDLPAVFHTVTIGAWLVFAGSWATRLIAPDVPKLIVFWLIAVVAVSSLRSVARAACRRSVSYLQNTLIVGAGDVGQSIARKLQKHPEYGINLVGFVDSEPREKHHDLDRLVILGELESLMMCVKLLDVERVIFAFSNQNDEQHLDLIRQLNGTGVQVDIVPRLFERVGPGASFHSVEGMPMIGLPPMRLGRFSLAMKRALDLGAACAMLILATPLLALIAMAVRMDSRGAVIHSDERIGRGGRVFRAYKFRTMRAEAGNMLDDLLEDSAVRREYELTHKLVTDPRITRIGSALRRSSLDELPQLVNVLKGDVSLVGPRPITQFEYERFHVALDATGEFYWNFGLRPGLTGHWQVNGRSSMSYADRVRMDRAYVGSWSLGLDLMILAKTVRVLLSRSGAV